MCSGKLFPEKKHWVVVCVKFLNSYLDYRIISHDNIVLHCIMNTRKGDCAINLQQFGDLHNNWFGVLN